MTDKEILAKLKALPKTEQNAIWRKCKLKALKSWQTWVAFSAYMILMATGSIIGEVFHLRVCRVNPLFMVGMMIGLFVFLFVWRRQLSRHAQEYL
jgi:hypothetical protein